MRGIALRGVGPLARCPLHAVSRRLQSHRRLRILASGEAAAPLLSTGTIVRTPAAEIRWGSFVSELPVLELAAKEAVGSILASIGEDSKPELAIVFATSALGDEFDQVVPLLRELVPSLKSIVGCSVRASPCLPIPAHS